MNASVSKKRISNARTSFITFIALSLILLFFFGSAVILPSAADPAVALSSADIPATLSLSQVQQAGHVQRLYAEESDLQTAVFRNQDGTNTAYMFAEPIKYVDSDGIVRDKKINVESFLGGGFYTTDNDVLSVFPASVADGITLSGNSGSIVMTPFNVNLAAAAPTLSGTSVVYENAMGNGIDLVYTPLLNGLKEDIVLEADPGIGSFVFTVALDGLEIGEDFVLYDADGSAVGSFGDIYVYDANGNTTVGTRSIDSFLPSQNGTTVYTFTVSVDREYLENAVYPVVVDPTLSYYVSTIYDTFIAGSTYVSAYNFGSQPFMYVGYESLHGTCTGLVGFSLFDSALYLELPVSAISGVTLHYTASGSGTVDVYMNDGASWSETGVTGSYSIMEGSYVGSLDLDEDDVDITEAAIAWKNGTASPEKGFIFTCSDLVTLQTKESSNAPYVTLQYDALVLSSSSMTLSVEQSATLTATTVPGGGEIEWSATGNVSISNVVNGPLYSSCTVTATAPGSGTVYASYGGTEKSCAVTIPHPFSVEITTPETEMYYGETRTLLYSVSSASATISWSSSNPNVATVSNSGVVTVVGVGTATITATVDGYSVSDTYSITVSPQKTISIEMEAQYNDTTCWLACAKSMASAYPSFTDFEYEDMVDIFGSGAASFTQTREAVAYYLGVELTSLSFTTVGESVDSTITATDEALWMEALYNNNPVVVRYKIYEAGSNTPTGAYHQCVIYGYTWESGVMRYLYYDPFGNGSLGTKSLTEIINGTEPNHRYRCVGYMYME